MKNPLFAFFGTPYIATIVLDRLEAHGFIPTLVITVPDKPAGRGLVLQPTPVKTWAVSRGIDVCTPEKLSDPAFIQELQNTDWDVFIVSMYAKLIPRTVLTMPKHGCLNVHPSLLPKFRGPSPVLSAILEDERETGVTIMQLDEKMDEGPIFAQVKVALEEETRDTPGWPPKGSEFESLLSLEGGKLLAEVLPLILTDKLESVPQEHSEATYTQKFTDQNALIDLKGNARKNYLKIKAFDTSPKPYFLTPDGKRVLVKEAVYQNNTLHILRVTPEGKKEMNYEDFIRGQKNPKTLQ